MVEQRTLNPQVGGSNPPASILTYLPPNPPMAFYDSLTPILSEIVNIPDTAVGEDLVYTIPDGEYWRIITIATAATNSGGTARNLRLAIHDSGGDHIYNSDTFTAPSGGTRYVTWGACQVNRQTGSYRMGVIPSNFVLPPGTIVHLHGDPEVAFTENAWLVQKIAVQNASRTDN